MDINSLLNLADADLASLFGVPVELAPNVREELVNIVNASATPAPVQEGNSYGNAGIGEGLAALGRGIKDTYMDLSPMQREALKATGAAGLGIGSFAIPYAAGAYDDNSKGNAIAPDVMQQFVNAVKNMKPEELQALAITQKALQGPLVKGGLITGAVGGTALGTAGGYAAGSYGNAEDAPSLDPEKAQADIAAGIALGAQDNAAANGVVNPVDANGEMDLTAEAPLSGVEQIKQIAATDPETAANMAVGHSIAVNTGLMPDSLDMQDEKGNSIPTKIAKGLFDVANYGLTGYGVYDSVRGNSYGNAPDNSELKNPYGILTNGLGSAWDKMADRTSGALDRAGRDVYHGLLNGADEISNAGQAVGQGVVSAGRAVGKSVDALGHNTSILAGQAWDSAKQSGDKLIQDIKENPAKYAAILGGVGAVGLGGAYAHSAMKGNAVSDYFVNPVQYNGIDAPTGGNLNWKGKAGLGLLGAAGIAGGKWAYDKMKGNEDPTAQVDPQEQIKALQDQIAVLQQAVQDNQPADEPDGDEMGNAKGRKGNSQPTSTWANKLKKSN